MGTPGQKPLCGDDGRPEGEGVPRVQKAGHLGGGTPLPVTVAELPPPHPHGSAQPPNYCVSDLNYHHHHHEKNKPLVRKPAKQSTPEQSRTSTGVRPSPLLRHPGYEPRRPRGSPRGGVVGGQRCVGASPGLGPSPPASFGMGVVIGMDSSLRNKWQQLSEGSGDTC